MRMDERLNLIIPVQRPGGPIYVHCTPLGRETFERHFLIIAKTFTYIMTEGLSVVAGPRVAALALRQMAQTMDIWDGPAGVEATLFAEMVRLANVVMPGETGWTTLPLYNAIRDKVFTDDERSEVLGALVFFTLSSAMHKRDVLNDILDRAGGLWGTQSSSLDCTAWADSLQTSTATANTGETAPTAAVPY